MYQPYCVRGSKGYLVHITHLPDLLWNQNRIYGLVWDAVVPTNEGVLVADYDLMAVWTLYCMYQPYWVCGSKGYLVHIAHIPFAVELKVAYMAKFGVPSFRQRRASLWQIMILWQFGLYCMYQTYWVRGSKGYLVHTAHIPPAVEWKIAYMAKFGVPSFPQSRESLWQVRVLWQFGRKTVCTNHIGSVGPRAIWYI